MLKPGARLGPYEVTGSLGKGGMGEVHLAKDTRLGREVALKVLPDDVAADGERMARFEREARLLAALNHPHIAAIYGIEEAGSTRALVMEVAAGSTILEILPAITPIKFFSSSQRLIPCSRKLNWKISENLDTSTAVH